MKNDDAQTRAEGLAAHVRRLRTELDRLIECLAALVAEPMPESIRTVALTLLTGRGGSLGAGDLQDINEAVRGSRSSIVPPPGPPGR